LLIANGILQACIGTSTCTYAHRIYCHKTIYAVAIGFLVAQSRGLFREVDKMFSAKAFDNLYFLESHEIPKNAKMTLL